MQTPSMVALSRLVAQQRAVEVASTNIANSGTAGFRTERVLFSDWIARQSGDNIPTGGRTISYVQDRATYRDQQHGTIEHTGNPLDLALSGDGYFTVQTAQGTRLTRAGRFALMSDGTIADADNNALLDTNGQKLRVSVADTRLTVTADGTLSSENGQLGRIAVVTPKDPSRMQAEGGRLFRADAGTTPTEKAGVTQGAVEGSNVQPVVEITRMMADLREFQFATQFVQAESDRQQSAIDKLTKRGN